MKEYLNSLSKSVLFKSLGNSEILDVLNKSVYNVESYSSNEIIAIEGDDCHSLGIVLEGSIEIHKPFPSGKIVTINHFSSGDIFGEAVLFSNQHIYPATVVASNKSKIMYIQRDEIIKLMSYDGKIATNFISVLSDRILMLNKRITNLSYDTLRKKIANILLLEYNRQKSKNIILPYSRKRMARFLNIARPSLSRELVNMKEEGLIDFYRNRVKILNLEGLEDELI